MAEHSENMRRWKARKEIAEDQSGSTRADAAEKAANDEITRLGEELAAVRADTMNGLTSKARVAHMSNDVEDSIQDDLLALAGLVEN